VKLLRSVISKIGFAENKQVDFNNNIHFIYGKNNSGKTLIAKSFIDTLYPQEPSLIVADEWDTMFATFTIQSNLTNIAIQRKGNKEVKIFTATDGDTRAKELSLQLPVVANSFSGDSHLERLHDLFNKDSFSLLSYIPSPLDNQYYAQNFSESIKSILLLDRSLYYCSFKKIFFPTANQSGNYYEHIADEIQDKIKHCKTKLDLIELKEQRQRKALAEIKALTDEITMHNEAIAIFQKKLKLLDEYIEILNAANNVAQQLQAVEQQIASLKEKLEKIKKYEKLIAAKYPQFKNFSQEKRNNIHAMQTIYRQIQSVSEEIETCMFNHETKNHKRARNLLIINVMFAFGILFLFLKPLFNAIALNRWLLLAILIGIQVVSAGYYIIYTMTHSINKLIAPLQQQKEEYQIKLETLLNQNNILLDSITIDEIYEFLLQYFEEYNEYNEKQVDLLTIQMEIDEQKSLADLEREKKEIESNYAFIKSQMDSFIQDIDYGHIETVEEAIAAKADIQHHCDEKKMMIQALQNKLKETPEEIADFNNEKLEVENEIHTLEKELYAIKEKKRVMTIVKDSFNDAVERFYHDALTVLTHTVKTMYPELTGDQFPHIDEEYIKKALYTSFDSTAPASVKYLLYVTVVFGLYTMLQQQLPRIQLPLIIDDPFVLMDEDAIYNFTEVMQQWAHSRQIIIFSHNSNIKKMYDVTEL